MFRSSSPRELYTTTHRQPAPSPSCSVDPCAIDVSVSPFLETSRRHSAQAFAIHNMHNSLLAGCVGYCTVPPNEWPGESNLRLPPWSKHLRCTSEIEEGEIVDRDRPVDDDHVDRLSYTQDPYDEQQSREASGNPDVVQGKEVFFDESYYQETRYKVRVPIHSTDATPTLQYPETRLRIHTAFNGSTNQEEGEIINDSPATNTIGQGVHTRIKIDRGRYKRKPYTKRPDRAVTTSG